MCTNYFRWYSRVGFIRTCVEEFKKVKVKIAEENATWEQCQLDLGFTYSVIAGLEKVKKGEETLGPIRRNLLSSLRWNVKKVKQLCGVCDEENSQSGGFSGDITMEVDG